RRRAPPADDPPGGALVLAGLLPLGRFAPGRDRMPAAGGAALATTMGMVDRIHGDPADMRAVAEPAAASGLADHDILPVGVRDRADAGHALGRNHPHLARGQP